MTVRRGLHTVCLCLLAICAAAHGAEPMYAPDRVVDVTHVAIDVTPDFAARAIEGSTTVEFTPIAEEVALVRLDAVDLEILAVTATCPVRAHHYDGRALTVSFAQPLAHGHRYAVTVAYRAQPAQGLYFRTPEMGYREEDCHLWTQGEPHEAPHWFVGFDYPNERFTSQVTCRVPPDMTVLSNGHKTAEHIDAPAGLKVVTWLQDTPHVNYLIALVAGRLKKIEGRYRDIPLGFYTPPSLIAYAEASFKDTADMLVFFEREIGVPYPWRTYNQVVVHDFAFGGMENTTLTVLNARTLHPEALEPVRSSQDLVAHELAHQWFGNLVTCKDWSHLWLNEGFATYYDALYDAHKNGKDAFLHHMYQSRNAYVRHMQCPAAFETPIVHNLYADSEEQFDVRAYNKGGWVLHMLRAQLGTALYQRCITTYLQRHAQGAVVTEDLRRVLEELSGRTFDRFFDQWLYRGGHPRLRVTYAWDAGKSTARIGVTQTQPVSEKVRCFHFPATLRFTVGSRRIDHEVRIDRMHHDFDFALPQAPRIVRFDPELSLCAEVDFEKPVELLYAQLADRDDMIGRLRAAEALGSRRDRRAAEALAGALAGDGFWAVRSAAATALGAMRTDDAFQALAGAVTQPDARVRLEVLKALDGFWRPEVRAIASGLAVSDTHQDVRAAAIALLGRYHHTDTRTLLLECLRTPSFGHGIAAGAVKAMDLLDDVFFATPLMEALQRDAQGFASGDFADALRTLGRLARTLDDREYARVFLANHVNHPKEAVRIGACDALGALEDPMAASLLEALAREDPGDAVGQAAQQALGRIRAPEPVGAEAMARIREDLDALRAENADLRGMVEDLRARFQAPPQDPEGGEDDPPARSF